MLISVVLIKKKHVAQEMEKNDHVEQIEDINMNILKVLKKVYWLVGGIGKLGDKFTLKKNECKNIKAYVFGKNRAIHIPTYISKENNKYQKNPNFLHPIFKFYVNNKNNAIFIIDSCVFFSK